MSCLLYTSLRNDAEDKERIMRALKQTNGNRCAAAELLGICLLYTSGDTYYEVRLGQETNSIYITNGSGDISLAIEDENILQATYNGKLYACLLYTSRCV